jgi:hypothetical protein
VVERCVYTFRAVVAWPSWRLTKGHPAIKLLARPPRGAAGPLASILFTRVRVTGLLYRSLSKDSCRTSAKERQIPSRVAGAVGFGVVVAAACLSAFSSHRLPL